MVKRNQNVINTSSLKQLIPDIIGIADNTRALHLLVYVKRKRK